MTAVRLHEEHGEVVATWVERGYRGEHVVCLDRHLDLKPLSDKAVSDCVGAPGSDPSALNRILPLREAPGAFGLDDFWSAGPISGRVDRLTWIVPGQVSGLLGRRRLMSAVSYIRAAPDVVDRTVFDADRLRTELCGLTVDIRSLDGLLAAPPADDFRIDVDLDWFAVPGQPNEFDPRLLAEELTSRGWLDRLDSLTYSVRSGFLDESQRWIADDLLHAVGRTGQRNDRSTLSATPVRSLAALRRGAHLAPAIMQDIVDSELYALDAVGSALEGLLNLYCSTDTASGTTGAATAVSVAERCWDRAAALGVQSTWLAYGLGQHWYRQGCHERARLWLDRARGKLDDPLEGHAQVLAALCSARVGDLADAADRAAELAAVFPLNVRVCSLAVVSARRIGRAVDPGIVRRLTTITNWMIGR